MHGVVQHVRDWPDFEALRFDSEDDRAVPAQGYPKTLHQWVRFACEILNDPQVRELYPDLPMVDTPESVPYVFVHKSTDIEELYGCR